MSAMQAEIDAILSRIPYARFLGVRMELHGDEMTGVLPFSDHLIGNPTLPALHGGVIGAFMEMTALAQLLVFESLKRQPRPVDVSIDYLRSGRPLDTYARALIKKVGRRIANVQVEAWQEARGAPIAALHGHFLLSPRES
jgi:acyl-coenzyme A thioesterase PaaI-like protein